MAVIDLGCGTGTIARSIGQAFPQARVTCLDLAENMIEMGQTQLARSPPEYAYSSGRFHEITNFD